MREGLLKAMDGLHLSREEVGGTSVMHSPIGQSGPFQINCDLQRHAVSLSLLRKGRSLCFPEALFSNRGRDTC